MKTDKLRTQSYSANGWLRKSIKLIQNILYNLTIMVKRSNNQKGKTDIVLAAKSVFKQYGYKKTSINDIANAVHKVKSAVYYYFPDKESVLKAVIDDEVEEVKKDIMDTVNGASGVEEQLLAYALSRTKEIKRLAQEYALFFEEYDQLFPIIKETHQRYDEFERTTIENILYAGISSGIFDIKSVDEVTTNILIWLKGLEAQIKAFPTEERLLNVVQSFVNVLFFGIKVR